MTDDLTRRDDPAAAPAPAPAQAPMPAPAPGGPVPSYIPAGIIARPTPAKAARGGLVTGALVIAALIAAAGVGFAGGRVTAPAAAATTRGNGLGNGTGPGAFPNASFRGNGGNGAGGFGGAFAAGNISLEGSVVAVGDGTITIQPAGGGANVVISVPSTATYHSQGSASSADVAVGTAVQVTVSRGQFRGGPDASGAPGAASASPGANGGNGLGLTATDITVTGK